MEDAQCVLEDRAKKLAMTGALHSSEGVSRTQGLAYTDRELEECVPR